MVPEKGREGCIPHAKGYGHERRSIPANGERAHSFAGCDQACALMASGISPEGFIDSRRRLLLSRSSTPSSTGRVVLDRPDGWFASRERASGSAVKGRALSGEGRGLPRNAGLRQTRSTAAQDPPARKPYGRERRLSTATVGPSCAHESPVQVSRRRRRRRRRAPRVP
jgi:hypothetical protein